MIVGDLVMICNLFVYCVGLWDEIAADSGTNYVCGDQRP